MNGDTALISMRKRRELRTPPCTHGGQCSNAADKFLTTTREKNGVKESTARRSALLRDHEIGPVGDQGVDTPAKQLFGDALGIDRPHLNAEAGAMRIDHEARRDDARAAGDFWNLIAGIGAGSSPANGTTIDTEPSVPLLARRWSRSQVRAAALRAAACG